MAMPLKNDVRTTLFKFEISDNKLETTENHLELLAK